jgi:pyruvate/2-oxoglutarate dehydrogenase complex dihydrolipoamide acyltransferase (E2) component
VPADLWEDAAAAVISNWYYEEGDEVEEGAIIADLMVEKATYELVAPAGGRLVALREVESEAAKGDIIAGIET